MLNRRLAPDVYLGVVTLDDDAGRVIDHLVEMRRLPDDLRLAALVAAESHTVPCVDQVVDLMARFHATAPTGAAIDASATLDAVRASSGTTTSPTSARTWARSSGGRMSIVSRCSRAGYLAGRNRLFDERIAAGRIRDGHGDLLAEDVFCLPDGPRVLDCLEFDDHLRYGDVLADVAFLAMDLERLERPDLARRLLDRYAREASDDWPDPSSTSTSRTAPWCARRSCASERSMVSAKPKSRRAGLLAPRMHLEAGRVRLVLIGGPPATGKTTLANAVGRTWVGRSCTVTRSERAGGHHQNEPRALRARHGHLRARVGHTNVHRAPRPCA